MFKKRRERKQAELHERLAAALRDPDAGVRATAATEAAESADLEWALPELARAVAREPWTDDFHETVVDGFAVTLRRDTALRERAERIVAGHLDDPEGFLRAWTAFMTELGWSPAPRDAGEDMHDDMRERLAALRGHGWSAQGLAGLGRPDAFERELAFDLAVMLASAVLRRNEPLSPEEADRVRSGMRSGLAEALKLAPGGTERTDALVHLARPAEEDSGTERARVALLVDEALALCADEDPERVALGMEALSDLLLFNGVLRYDRVRATLDRLVAGEPDAPVLRDALSCYDYLHVHAPLAEPPLPLFLDGLRHADAGVRRAAADGLHPMAAGSTAERAAVDALAELVERDEDEEVRLTAAASLANLPYAEERNALAAADALERHLDAPDPELRAIAVGDALGRGVPDAYDRLLHEFESPDVHWQFVSGLAHASANDDVHVPDDLRPRLVERLESLEASGWADRGGPADGFPDAEERAEMLSGLLRQLRAGGR
ncbi:HEAT repeat domain-containing protein [Streptomyces luteocolor]|uniref:HEAT repeat domain-containing protein n=1 Tax=Streptomyces luteocolor TaxID=285500 RepID=UPI0008536F9B|nr:HEAT repeat domain-containing protein [Streptomyces luteocolor]